MSFLKSLFKKKEQPISSNADFWNWFQEHENTFYDVIKNQGNIKDVFFSKLSPKLNELKEGYWFLTGMLDDDTAELILTADGIIKNIVFVEELVAQAPLMKNWKITALKPPSGSKNFGIEMQGYKFDEHSMSFYSVDHKDMPDEIDITIVHKDLNKKNQATITNGVYLTLDNNLGELNSIATIDNVTMISPSEATEELIPFEKLKDFLNWRQKEFIEKYKGLRHNTENDSFSALEATTENGLPLLAIINMDVLTWDSKASHPWIVVVKLAYDGKRTNGMPNTSDYELLNEIEDKIVLQLKDYDGYINVGRQTVDSVREIYFTCIEFRKPSKVLYELQKEYQDSIGFDFEIYKDKYWQSFNRFIP